MVLSKSSYDYLIVGAGPAGLMLAWGLSKLGKKILLIDRENSIGGCHRVRRVDLEKRVDFGKSGLFKIIPSEYQDGYFTEHGPRVYVTNYFQLKQMMAEMDMSWSDYFTDYTEMSRVFGPFNEFFSFSDYLKFVPEFLWMMFDQTRSREMTVEEFARQAGFSDRQIDFLDRICRLTDGAEASRYTLFEFLQLVNQNSLYQIQQPRFPLDVSQSIERDGKFVPVGMWKTVTSNLENRGVVIRLGTSFESFHKSEGYHNVLLRDVASGIDQHELVERIIFTVPPTSMIKILEPLDTEYKAIFGDFNQLRNWARSSEYLTYLPITFHWNQKIKLPKVWGYPQSSWGVAFIPLSEYMDSHANFGGIAPNKSKTVISICLMRLDIQSPVTLTVHQTESKHDLLTEAFRQLKNSFPDLPDPDRMFLSPDVHFSESEWKSNDAAFVLTKNGFLKDSMVKDGFFSQVDPTISWCGVQNGQSKYHFTTMESAMSNAVVLLNLLHPETKDVYYVRKPWSLTDLIFLLFFLLFFLFFYFRF